MGTGKWGRTICVIRSLLERVPSMEVSLYCPEDGWIVDAYALVDAWKAHEAVWGQKLG